MLVTTIVCIAMLLLVGPFLWGLTDTLDWYEIPGLTSPLRKPFIVIVRVTAAILATHLSNGLFFTFTDVADFASAYEYIACFFVSGVTGAALATILGWLYGQYVEFCLSELIHRILPKRL